MAITTHDWNHFKNMFEVTGRDFRVFKERMLKIPVPAKIMTMGVKASGIYYAILIADRPAKEVEQRMGKGSKDE